MTGIFTPNAGEPIVGWRFWHPELVELVDSVEPRPDAHSVSFRLFGVFGVRDFSEWPMYEALRARCRNQPSGHEDAPTDGCSCGIYGFRTLAQLLSALEAMPRRLIGEVLLWGKVIVTERGYRAQYAYPKRLLATEAFNLRKYDAMDRELESAYGLEIARTSWESVLREAGLW